MAQDLLPGTGDPINNAYAPFPTADDAVSAPDAFTVNIGSVEALGGGAVWQAWLVNRDEEEPTIIPATGTYELVEITRVLDDITGEIISEDSTVVETVSGTASFVV